MDDKEKLYLMLEEYRALRAEEIARTRLEHQFYGLAVAIGMALAIAGTFAHRPGLFLGFVILTAILLGCPMVLMQHEIAGLGKRLREIEYEINTRTKDRLFARESDRTPLQVNWADREALQQNWARLRADSRIYAERWRNGVRQFRESVRGRSNRQGPLG
jgi:hypothetical protein